MKKKFTTFRMIVKMTVSEAGWKFDVLHFIKKNKKNMSYCEIINNFLYPLKKIIHLPPRNKW